MLYCGRTQSAKYSYGENDEMSIIAAVVLGGTAMTGGTGSVVGALVGSMLMGIINNGLVMGGLGVPQQKIVRGLIIIAAVTLSNIAERRKRV
jgi:ribose transport system permease protein